MHPGSLRPRHLAGPLFAAALLLGVAVTPWSPWLLVSTSIAYVLALSLATVVTSRPLSPFRVKVRLPLAFFVMHIGWGLGFWQGLAGQIRNGISRRRLIRRAAS